MEEGSVEEYAHDNWPKPQRFLVLRVPASMVLHFTTICWYCCLQKDREDLCQEDRLWWGDMNKLDQCPISLTASSKIQLLIWYVATAQREDGERGQQGNQR